MNVLQAAGRCPPKAIYRDARLSMCALLNSIIAFNDLCVGALSNAARAFDLFAAAQKQPIRILHYS